MRAACLAEEAILGWITRKFFVGELEKVGVLHPLDEGVLVVAELYIGASLNAIDLSPLLPRFLHGGVVIFVDAFTTGNKAVVVITDFIGSCHFALHPWVVNYLFQCDAFLGVMLGEAKDEIEEVSISLDIAIGHGTHWITVEAAVVGVVRLCERELRKFQYKQNCTASKDIDSHAIVGLFAAKEFGGHVVWSTAASFKLLAIGAFECFLETKVGNL